MALPNLKDACYLVERVESTRLVFRVFDDHSRRDYSPDTGFVAHISHPFDPSDRAEVERSVEKHIQFKNSRPTPWISTTRRWLWAVWEANRRANMTSVPRTNIRIAVIDLDACLAASQVTPISALGYHDLPFIHSLSGLSNAEIRLRRFANASDEILIYRQVPASAIISIWSFDKSSIRLVLPSRLVDVLPPSENTPIWLQSFGSSYGAVACQFLTERHGEDWNAAEMGIICATTSLAIMKDAYTRLDENVEEIVNRARVTDMGDISTSKTFLLRIRPRGFAYPYPFSQVDGMEWKYIDCRSHPNPLAQVISIVHGIMNELVQLQDPFCRKAIEAIITREIRYLVYQAKTLSRQTYRDFLAYNNTFINQVMCIINSSAPFIQARHARYQLDRFLGLALELARTVPLGLMDELDITAADWMMMKRFMLQTILAKLTPLENKLLPLVSAPWIGSILDPQGQIEHDAEELKKRKWMRKELNYPKWWEECGIRESTVHHRPAARRF